MPRTRKPHVHARDHEHGGADPSLIHYEDVGGGAGGGGSVQGFCTYEGFQASTPLFPHPQELPFGDSAGFNSNDPASFDFSGGRVRILQAGGYLVFGQLHPVDFQLETNALAVAMIYDIYGIDADGNRADVILPLDAPVPALVTKGLLPGAGGVPPTLQYLQFINLRDDYSYGGTRPAVWPVAMHMRMDWSADDPHDVRYSLTIMRFG